ncbi:MAG: DUF512 domain-containing protein, partial [Ruminococcaceae bacterium]|nr:DUF512 domain-containing protein [Oscillospiraceae bacterium]
SKPLIDSLVEQVRSKNPAVNAEVVPIVNQFFGERITVTGLVTGGDIIKQLEGRELGTLLICDSMLKEGTDLFLDDTTVRDVERALGVSVRVVRNDGTDFVQSLLEP